MAGKKFKQRKTDVIQDGIVYRMYKETYSVYTYTEDLPERVVVADKIGDIPVTVLDTKCFWHSECREVILPETIEVIKTDAFKCCENLEEISIPNGVREVQAGAFKRCDKLKQTLYSHGLYIGNPQNRYLILRTNRKTGRNDLTVEVHPETKFILETAFSVCHENGSLGFASPDGIKQLILHDNLIFIAPSAFHGSWVPFYIPTICIDSIEWLCKYGKRLPGRLHERLLVGEKNTDGTIIIPASVANIPRGCFREYDCIKKVCFEGNIMSIGCGAFAHCENLMEIHFPPKVGHIEEYAFAHCPDLNHVDFYEVEKIGSHAFELCESDYHRRSWERKKVDPSKAGLKQIFFHNHIGEICDQAFAGNLNLQSINGLESVEGLEGDPFIGTPFEKKKEMSEKRNFEYGLHEENKMTVTLTLDDDSELECAVVAIFPVNGKDYIALLPLGEENPEVFLYRFLHNEEDDLQLENIEDDEEFELVADAYDALADEAQFI